MSRTMLARGAILVALVAMGPGWATATHATPGHYEQPILYTWHTSHLNILLIPPAPNEVGSTDPLIHHTYEEAMRAAVAHWEAAVQTFGPTWLRDNFSLTVHVATGDAPGPTSLGQEDVHIVMAMQQYSRAYVGAAAHANSLVDGAPCVAVVPQTWGGLRGYLTYNDVFNVFTHEVGHCLGLDHVPDHEDDVMDDSYPFATGLSTTPRQCVSNLNVAGLELVFGGLHGMPSGGTATVPVTEYERLAEAGSDACDPL